VRGLVQTFHVHEMQKLRHEKNQKNSNLGRAGPRKKENLTAAAPDMPIFGIVGERAKRICQ